MDVGQARDVGFHGRGVKLVIFSIVFTVVAMAFVAARVFKRVHTGRKLYHEDFVIVASVVASMGLGAVNCVGVYYGYGNVAATLAPSDLRAVLGSFFACQISYKVTISLTKVSILLLYLRAFAPTNTHPTRFRPAAYLVMAYVICYAIASIVATVLQCTPVTRMFNKHIPGHCINLTVFWYANAGFNIAGDFTILVLPIQAIFKLQMPLRQKTGIFVAFGLGFFVCVTSILRMTTLNPASKSLDQVYGTLDSTIWTTIEANTAIICACLPMLKKPLSSLFPRLFPRGSRHDYNDMSGPAPRRGCLDCFPKAKTPEVHVDIGLSTMCPHAVPPGAIAKTTDLNVEFGERREGETTPASTQTTASAYQAPTSIYEYLE